MKMIIRSGCMRMRNHMTGDCSTFFQHVQSTIIKQEGPVKI